MVDDWISLRATVEREPRRLTVMVTVGELPGGWSWSVGRARRWAALIGLVLIVPFVALIVAGALRAAGLDAPYELMSGSSVAIVAASMSLFVGVPVAVALNVWGLARVGVRHDARILEGVLALEFAPLQLIVLVLALGIGAAFVGHLAADSYACWNGVRSAC